MEFKASDPLSLGVELELQLLDQTTLDLADGILHLIDHYPASPYVKPEFIQNTVEIASKVCRSVADLERHMRGIVQDLKRCSRGLGMTLCGAGSHPFSERLALITPLPRYRRLGKVAGYLGHNQITFATHVHIGMRSGDEAMAVMSALKPYLPILIAVSANSPFWRGYETGYAAYRLRILAAARSYGLPPSFEAWEQFCEFFETARDAGVFETIHDIHWDIRPRPHLGTLEIRVMDAQSTIAETMALAGTLRALVFFVLQNLDHNAGALLPPQPWWMLKENHFQATRRGIKAHYVQESPTAVRTIEAIWRAICGQIRPIARELGEAAYLEGLERRVAERAIGYQRQLRVYRETGSLRRVVETLVQGLAEPDAG